MIIVLMKLKKNMRLLIEVLIMCDCSQCKHIKLITIYYNNEKKFESLGKHCFCFKNRDFVKPWDYCEKAERCNDDRRLQELYENY